VLVGDGISPFVELIKQLLSRVISPVERLHAVPDSKAEPCKIRADIAGVGVASVEFAVAYKLASEDVLQGSRNLLDDVVHAL